jgi:hypothetical protein
MWNLNQVLSDYRPLLMRWWDNNSNQQIWCMQYLGFSRWCWWWFKSSGIWWFVVELTHSQTGVLDPGHEGGTVLQSVEHATVSYPRRHASSDLWWSKLGCGERQAFKWRQAPDGYIPHAFEQIMSSLKIEFLCSSHQFHRHWDLENCVIVELWKPQLQTGTLLLSSINIQF